ncbi:hypothetical protein FCU45_06200 [Sulfurimonas crateris]|uniref:Pentapeptide repeat-containing protein n=1 Tax=Sulfurimonas crateris TaxID=2574727 RepID=A0A4U2Z5Z8_9BACT|nr:pentapeptide repeat-containing protein [Sulfurimonas crateris]TKI69647.1 hypothetical protein FCU45_06200 [Sulfurimonas crateris]
MATYSVENCNNECFDAEQNKCILHCKKDDWYEIKDNKKDWSKSTDEIKLFWKAIRNIISESQSRIAKFLPIPFNNIIFPKFEGNGLSSSVLGYEDSFFEKEGEKKFTQTVKFNHCTFLDCVDFTYIQFEKDIVFSECILKDEIKFKKQLNIRISFLECPEIESLDFSRTVFEQKVEIKDCVIKSCDFENTRFKSLADFYKTEFYGNLFFKTTFEDIVVFTESKFHEDVNFKYTTFKKLALFRKTLFKKKLNLDDSIIKEEANFLEITSKEDKIEVIDVENRETARIIKNSFEQQNNIIEANRFYAKEMEEREKELNKDMIKGKNITEWLIFKAHAISSNHSQDWLLALFWIIIFGALYTIVSFCSSNTCLSNVNTPILIGSIFLVSFYSLHVYNMRDYKQFTKYIFLFLLFVNYFTLTKDFNLSCLADKINPFSIMTSEESITFGLLMFKITIAYLIYQFIVSVRQNTRRK